LEKGVTSSMARDLQAGKKLELEALNGAIARIGNQRGVPTPLNQTIYAALKPYENGLGQ
jgi:2-dehydropantoate 2-reductase